MLLGWVNGPTRPSNEYKFLRIIRDKPEVQRHVTQLKEGVMMTQAGHINENPYHQIPPQTCRKIRKPQGILPPSPQYTTAPKGRPYGQYLAEIAPDGPMLDAEGGDDQAPMGVGGGGGGAADNASGPGRTASDHGGDWD